MLVKEVPRGFFDAWEGVRKLGSLLGEENDINRRKSLASGAFKSIGSLWRRGRRVALWRRIRIYNAYVLPVLTYNCATWGLTDTEIRSLSAFHRRHMRSILRIRWPNTISNENLYKVTNVTPLEDHISKCRWGLLGHVLRLDRSAPAQKAMDLYFSPGTRPRGRPKDCLQTRIRKDLVSRGYNFKSQEDLDEIRAVAADRVAWKILGGFSDRAN